MMKANSMSCGDVIVLLNLVLATGLGCTRHGDANQADVNQTNGSLGGADGPESDVRAGEDAGLPSPSDLGPIARGDVQAAEGPDACYVDLTPHDFGPVPVGDTFAPSSFQPCLTWPSGEYANLSGKTKEMYPSEEAYGDPKLRCPADEYCDGDRYVAKNWANGSRGTCRHACPVPGWSSTTHPVPGEGTCHPDEFCAKTVIQYGSTGGGFTLGMCWPREPKYDYWNSCPPVIADDPKQCMDKHGHFPEPSDPACDGK